MEDGQKLSLVNQEWIEILKTDKNFNEEYFGELSGMYGENCGHAIIEYRKELLSLRNANEMVIDDLSQDQLQSLFLDIINKQEMKSIHKSGRSIRELYIEQLNNPNRRFVYFLI